MMNHGKLALLATLLVPSAALAQINVGDELGASETAIRAALQAQGYAVTEVEIEDSEIEVEARLGGRSIEIEVSPETGLILSLYQEDDNGEDDDDNDEEDYDNDESTEDDGNDDEDDEDDD